MISVQNRKSKTRRSLPRQIQPKEINRRIEKNNSRRYRRVWIRRRRIFPLRKIFHAPRVPIAATLCECEDCGCVCGWCALHICHIMWMAFAALVCAWQHLIFALSNLSFWNKECGSGSSSAPPGSKCNAVFGACTILDFPLFWLLVF